MRIRTYTKTGCFIAASLVLSVLVGCGETNEHRFGGYLEAEQIQVGSRVGGRVKEVLVEEGDEVKAKAVLVRFEVEHLKAGLAEAEHRRDRLREQWNKLREGGRFQEKVKARELHKAAEARYVNALETYNRALELGNAVTKQELKDKKTAMEVAEADRNALAAAVELVSKSRAEDINIAAHAVKEAESVVDKLRVELDEGEVHAPEDALVEAIDLEPGDLVAGGAPVATLVRRGEIWVRCFVPSTLVTLIKRGDRVQVLVDSRPDEYFVGTVTRVNRVAEFTPRNVQTFEQREDQVVGVKVRVNDPGEKLRPGMAVTVLLPKLKPNAR